jgi:hypothetical protein
MTILNKAQTESLLSKLKELEVEQREQKRTREVWRHILARGQEKLRIMSIATENIRKDKKKIERVIGAKQTALLKCQHDELLTSNQADIEKQKIVKLGTDLDEKLAALNKLVEDKMRLHRRYL